MFKAIWNLKNPTLRAIRLKVVYKDVFSNERRHRFGIIDSPACVVCAQVETVEHHLFLCANATRVWDILFRLTGTRLTSLFDVLYCTSNIDLEIIKSVLIKSLLQIDRSQTTSDRTLVTECIHYLGVEAQANPGVKGKLKLLIDRIRTDNRI